VNTTRDCLIQGKITAAVADQLATGLTNKDCDTPVPRARAMMIDACPTHVMRLLDASGIYVGRDVT